MYLLVISLLGGFCLQARCQPTGPPRGSPKSFAGDTFPSLNGTGLEAGSMPVCGYEREPISSYINPQHCIFLINKILREAGPRADDEIFWATTNPRRPRDLLGHLPLETGYKSCFFSVTVATPVRSRPWRGAFSLDSLVKPFFGVFDTCVMKTRRLFLLVPGVRCGLG